MGVKQSFCRIRRAENVRSDTAHLSVPFVRSRFLDESAWLFLYLHAYSYPVIILLLVFSFLFFFPPLFSLALIAYFIYRSTSEREIPSRQRKTHFRTKKKIYPFGLSCKYVYLGQPPLYPIPLLARTLLPFTRTQSDSPSPQSSFGRSGFLKINIDSGKSILIFRVDSHDSIPSRSFNVLFQVFLYFE